MEKPIPSTYSFQKFETCFMNRDEGNIGTEYLQYLSSLQTSHIHFLLVLTWVVA